MPKITIKSSELTKLSNSVKKRSEKIGKNIILECAQDTAHKADWAFKRAKYDGANSVSVYSKTSNKNAVQIVAEGSAVNYIEYGTGKEANENFARPLNNQYLKQDSNRVASGTADYWFYTLPANNKFKAGGTYARGKLTEEAKERRKQAKNKYDEDFIQFLFDKEKYLYKANANSPNTYKYSAVKGAYDKGLLNWQKKFQGSEIDMDEEFDRFLYKMAVRPDGQIKGSSDFEWEYKASDYDKSTTSGITDGNPPHLIMTDQVPKNFKKAIKQYK